MNKQELAELEAFARQEPIDQIKLSLIETVHERDAEIVMLKRTLSRCNRKIEELVEAIERVRKASARNAEKAAYLDRMTEREGKKNQ